MSGRNKFYGKNKPGDGDTRKGSNTVVAHLRRAQDRHLQALLTAGPPSWRAALCSEHCTKHRACLLT